MSKADANASFGARLREQSRQVPGTTRVTERATERVTERATDLRDSNKTPSDIAGESGGDAGDGVGTGQASSDSTRQPRLDHQQIASSDTQDSVAGEAGSAAGSGAASNERDNSGRVVGAAEDRFAIDTAPVDGVREIRTGTGERIRLARVPLEYREMVRQYFQSQNSSPKAGQ